MTGFKSKKAAALDEEGMYLVHQTDQSEVVLNMVAQSEPMAYCYVQQGSSVDILTFDDKPIDAIKGTLFPLYTAPPQRPWVDLTEDQIKVIEEKALTKQWAIRMTIAQLKECNAFSTGECPCCR